MLTRPSDILESYFSALLTESISTNSDRALPGSTTGLVSTHSEIKKGEDGHNRDGVLHDTKERLGPSYRRALPESREKAATPGFDAIKSREDTAISTKTKPLASAVEALSPEPALADEKKQQLQTLLTRQELCFPAVAPKTELDHKCAETNQVPEIATVSEGGICASDMSTENILPPAWQDNGRPQWAQDAFDAILFDVMGLKLAVPLISLGQIVPINDALSSIFGQSDWFMGILSSSLGPLKIVNTALFVMPEKYDDAFVSRAEYAVSLHGMPWALAVEGVDQPIRVDPDDVVWRHGRSRRPWLAGTVKSAMCALIDTPTMAEVLDQSETKSRVVK